MCDVIPFPTRQVIKAQEAPRQFSRRGHEARCTARALLTEAIAEYRNAGMEDAASWLEAAAYQIDDTH